MLLNVSSILPFQTIFPLLTSIFSNTLASNLNRFFTFSKSNSLRPYAFNRIAVIGCNLLEVISASSLLIGVEIVSILYLAKSRLITSVTDMFLISSLLISSFVLGFSLSLSFTLSAKPSAYSFLAFVLISLVGSFISFLIIASASFTYCSTSSLLAANLPPKGLTSSA